MYKEENKVGKETNLKWNEQKKNKQETYQQTTGVRAVPAERLPPTTCDLHHQPQRLHSYLHYCCLGCCCYTEIS